MKPRLPRRRLWRIAIYLASLGLVLTAIDLVLVQLRRDVRPGYQTTRIIGPTLPDGRIDYLLAVDEHFGRGVTPENNAAIPLLRALGRDALSPAQPPNGVTNRIGMEPVPEKGDYFQGFYDYRKAHNAPSELESDTETRPLAVMPPPLSALTRDWVIANERPLNRMVEASRRERFFIPFYAGNRPETMISVHLKHLLPLREASRALMARARIRLEKGDPAGFQEDMLAVHRWARLLNQTPTLIERIVGMAIETGACTTDRMAAAGGRLTPANARALEAELSRLGDLPSPAEALDVGERYSILDTCQWMARGGPGNVAILMDVILPPVNGAPTGQASWPTRALTRFLPVPYEKSMRSLNMFYDGAADAWRQPTWSQRREAISLWEQEVERSSSQNPVSLFLDGHWPMIYLLPSLMRVNERTESARAELRLTRLVLALAAYKADKGQYPPRLDDLTPAYLPEPLPDPFTDTPFLYTPTPDGYRLYSVGPNMKDDRGDPNSADDITAHLDRHSLTTAPASR